MKAKPAELARKLDAPPADVRLYLFYGPDDAQARVFAARLGGALGPEAERIDLEPAQLKAQPGLLADEAAALSLFGGKRWIRVAGAGEESLEAATLLLGAPQAGNPAVLLAPALKGTAKLVKLAADHSAAIACQFYLPEGVAADRLAADLARREGLRLVGDAATQLAAAAGGDQAVLAQEVVKLALYLDAAPDRPRDVDGEVLAVIGAALAESDTAPAVDALVAGRPDSLGRELATLAGTSPVPLLRAMVRRLLALADMQAQVAGGARLDSVAAQGFWKERDANAAALRRWSAAELRSALGDLRRAERAAMTGGSDSEVAAILVGIARSSARKR